MNSFRPLPVAVLALLAVSCGGSQSNPRGGIQTGGPAVVHMLSAGDGAQGAAVAVADGALYLATNFRGGLEGSQTANGIAVQRVGEWMQTVAQREGTRIRAVGAAASSSDVFTAIVSSTGESGPQSSIRGFEGATGTPTWTVDLGATGYAVVRDLAASADGRVYAVGAFAGVLEVGDTTLRSEGLQDGFVVAISAKGKPTWAKRFGGSGGDYAAAVAVDPKDGIAVAGAFTGEAAVDRATLTSNDDSFDVVVLRLRSDGALLWVKSVGGAGTDTPAGVAIAGGRVAIAATFEAALMIGAAPVSADGPSDVLVKAWNADGTDAWAKTLGGPGLDVAAGIAASTTGFAFAGTLAKDGSAGEQTIQAGAFLGSVGDDGSALRVQPLRGLQPSAVAGRAGIRAAVAGTLHGELRIDDRTVKAPGQGAAVLVAPAVR
mgnify:CR=1 FL=1